MATIQSNTVQNRVNQMYNSWLKESKDKHSVAGKQINADEARTLIAQAQGLGSAEEVAQLKEFLRADLKKSSFSQDARKELQKFLDSTPDKQQVSSTERREVNNAQKVKEANENPQVTKVSAEMMKEQLDSLEALPAEAKQFVATQLLLMRKEGTLDLDPDANKMLVRFCAKNGVKVPEGDLSVNEQAKLMGMGNLSREEKKEKLEQVAQHLGQGADVMAQMAQQRLPPDFNPATMGPGMNPLWDPPHVKMMNIMTQSGGLSALDNALNGGYQPESYAMYVAAHGGSFEEILFAFLMQMADKADKKLLEAIEQASKGGGGNNAVGQALNQINGDKTPDPESVGKSQMPGQGGNVSKVSRQLEAVVASAHRSTKPDGKGGVEITKEEAQHLVSKLKVLPANVQGLLATSMCSAIKAKGLPLQREAFRAIREWGQGVVGEKFDVDHKPYTFGKDGKPTEVNKAAMDQLRTSNKLEDRIASYLVDTLATPGGDLKTKLGGFQDIRADFDRFVEQNVPQPSSATPPQGSKSAPTAADPTTAAEPGAPAATPGTPNPMPAAPDAASAPQGAQQPPPESEARVQNRIQHLMQLRSRAFDMLSNMMKAMQDSIMTSVRNMR